MVVRRETIGMEVAQADHVEADGLHSDQILKRCVEPADPHAVVDPQMEVIDERL